jgi:hypothetical protein
MRAGKENNHPRWVRRRRLDENTLRHAGPRWEGYEVAMIERSGVRMNSDEQGGYCKAEALHARFSKR